MESPESIFARYRDLQSYVGWTAADERRVTATAEVIAPRFIHLVDDFYTELQKHPAASRAITGGAEQIERLKRMLERWLSELFAGPYDEEYVARRWRVGLRHAEIGLPQVYTAAALSRLRNGMIGILRSQWKRDEAELALTLQALNKLLDLDLAVIGDAYETDYVRREQEAERRRLDEVLHREKELSASLLAHAQAAVVILDQSGRIRRWNAFLETLIVGCADGPVENRDWFELFFAPEDRSRARRTLDSRTAMISDSAILSSTLPASGRTRHLHWSVVPLNDAAGQPFAVLAIGQDVTDLYEAQQRSLQAERLAAIGQMATGLAHESRNALQRIGASAEMLEFELEGNAAAQELVARIQQSKDHLHQLLDEVRNYAAPIVLDRSPFRITEAWREAWELLLAERRGRTIELRERVAARDLVVVADRFRLVQVFRNLLDNALAAASDPVFIEIFCEPASLERVPALAIRVRDNGPGLTTEQQRRIFEPFYTTKPTGTGLGTAIAQRLVESHGGTITVGDCSHRGAELVVTLPQDQKTNVT